MKKPALRKMSRNGGAPAALRGFGVAALLVALAELALCFYGPIAFIRKPSLMMFPPFAEGLPEKDSARVEAFLEREIARANSYSIVSRTFMLNDSVRRNPDFDTAKLSPGDEKSALAAARDLGLERFGTANLYLSEGWCGLYVRIHDARDGETIRSGNFGSPGLDELLRKTGMDGKPLDIGGELAVKTKGFGLTDFIVFALLGLQMIFGLRALAGKVPEALAEIILGTAAVLFIFAFIYAKSANMDYVQRYIAMGGGIQLAGSTAQEQLYALLRFGPVMTVFIAFYAWRRLASPRENGVKPAGCRFLRSFARWAFPWTAVSAFLFALSFPSFVSLDGFGILAWFALVPLLVVLGTARPGMAVFYGVFFGTLQALLINFWHGTYDYVTLHMITVVFAVEYFLFMLVLVPLRRTGGKWGFFFIAAAWTLFDYLRSVGFLGYPWGLIGTSQYKFLPFIQAASVTGVWGLGFGVVLCNAALAQVLAGTGDGGERKSLREFLFPVEFTAAALAVWLMAGSFALRATREKLYGDPAVPSVSIVLVQPNFDARKYVLEDNIRELRSLTDAAVASLPEKPDMVVWPEGEFEVDMRWWTAAENADSYWGRVAADLLAYQRKLGSSILTGTLDHEMVAGKDGGEERVNYNSAVLVGPDGRLSDFYHKMHLVPFSEYFPLDREKFSALYKLFESYEISHWGVGRNRLVFQHGKMRFAAPICFEDVFPDHVRRFVLRDADIIMNLGNDYWSLSPVEGIQHGIFAIFRAVENRRPVLRCTASGYTVYADAAGGIQPGSPAPYTPGFLAARVPLPEKTLTLYTRWGDWFPLACGVVTAAFFAVRLITWRRRREG